MTTKIAVYNPEVAKRHQDALVAQSQQIKTQEPEQQEPTPQQTTQTSPEKELDQMGYEDLQEKQKNKKIRNLFK